MCHAILALLRHVQFLTLFIILSISVATVFSALVIDSTLSSGTIATMPVTTRSMAKGGLQKNITSAPPPFQCPTCTNAIPNVLPAGESKSSLSSQILLPGRIIQAETTQSSSTWDSDSNSSSSLHSGISNFQNFKIAGPSSLLYVSQPDSNHFFEMEADCKEEPQVTSTSSSSNDEILKILTAISSQMVVGQQDLQNQLLSSNQSLQAELQKVRDENEKFKQEMRAEFQNSSPVVPTTTTVVDSTTSVSAPLSVSSSNSSMDFQSQMLAVLNETFSKLSSVIGDKSSETKSDWMKFSGDPKKFRSWYQAIMAQLSIAPWTPLYNSDTNSVVKITTNDALNGKLYAKVIGALEGSALQHMLARKHVRGNGIMLLQELHQMYKPKCVPEVIAAKTVEFWGQTKRSHSESVDEYYNRFQELLEEINEEIISIPAQQAIRHFIFTLGDEFLPLQNNYRLGTVSEEWKTQDWPSLLVLCRDFYNSVNPKGPTAKRERGGDKDPFSEFQIDRSSHHKKIRSWFSNPTKHKHDLELEQRKYPGRCIYHLSKTHSTSDCHIKIECDRRGTSQRSGPGNATFGTQSSASTGQLRHITEEVFEDAIDEDSKDECLDETANDTNEVDLLYFARVSKHYLRLVKNDLLKSPSSRHLIDFPIIIDSGTNFHMFKHREFFTSLLPATGRVILGDGQTSLHIQGVGTIKCYIGSNEVILPNVRFVPDLSENIYSLFLHIKTPGHGIQSSFDKGLFLSFPSFQTQAIIGADDLYLDALPSLSTNLDNTSSVPVLDDGKCCNVKTFQEDLLSETVRLDNLLHNLREYYESVKTKRQLQLEVPAGFRRMNNHNKDLISHLRSQHAVLASSSNSNDSLSNLTQNILIPMSNLKMSSNMDSNEELSTTQSSSHPANVPIIRCVDKPSTTLPHNITVSEDFMRASMGFRRLDTVKKYLKELYCDNIHLDSTPPDAILDLGDVATLHKKPRNTTPVPRSSFFGQVMHMDIVFGPEVAIGNVHFGLLFTDRFSRMTYIYPLRNLTTDIPKQLEAFFAHLGFSPHRLITDFDLKLIGGKAREYLNGLLIHVNAAPSLRQDKNGLAERHWQTMVSMARNWLASAELPASFWFYAVRRAAEICNYFPSKLDSGKFITPFELVHHQKPDLRVLFPMFGLAAVRRERVGDSKLSKFDAQSIPMIAVGRCQQSNGLQFYNPSNGTFVSSVDYRFQPYTTSGTRFGYKYQPGTFIYRLDESNSVFTPKYNLDSSVLIHTHSPPHKARIIGIPSYDKPNVYTVVFADGSIAEYDDTDNLIELIPDVPTTEPSNLLPNWIQNGSNATLFLSSMSKPRHGKLRVDSKQNWVFTPGNSTDLSKGILLVDLVSTFQQLMDTGQLFKGHTKFQRVYNARTQAQLKDSILRHVSAHGLTSLIAPVSLNSHQKMNDCDKSIWDAAYDEEFDGLNDLPTWEVLTESEFKLLSKGVKPLPSMAIATIKYDTFNKPKRAKYRIVVWVITITIRGRKNQQQPQ